MLIKIPFDDRFCNQMLDGTKVCTTRTKKYGQRTDHFVAWGATFVIESVELVYLYRVAVLFFPQEGFCCVDDFIRYWTAIYPKRGYVANQQVYLHKFFRET